MPKDSIREALLLISSKTEIELVNILDQALATSPSVSLGAILKLFRELDSVDVRLQCLLWRNPVGSVQLKDGIEYQEEIYSDPHSGIKGLKGIPYKPTIIPNEKWIKDAEKVAQKATSTTTNKLILNGAGWSAAVSSIITALGDLKLVWNG